MSRRDDDSRLADAGTFIRRPGRRAHVGRAARRDRARANGQRMTKGRKMKHRCASALSRSRNSTHGGGKCDKRTGSHVGDASREREARDQVEVQRCLLSSEIAREHRLRSVRRDGPDTRFRPCQVHLCEDTREQQRLRGQALQQSCDRSRRQGHTHVVATRESLWPDGARANRSAHSTPSAPGRERTHGQLERWSSARRRIFPTSPADRAEPVRTRGGARSPCPASSSTSPRR